MSIFRIFVFTITFIGVSVIQTVFPQNLVQNNDDALHRGVFEIVLEANPGELNPYFDVDFKVLFTRPDETQVTVNGFFDGDRQFKARAYCDMVGEWQWTSISNLASLNGQKSKFTVVPSALKGKLRKHPDDPHQFAYDNGDWFLHIGDTGYRFVTATEPEWQAYIDQAVQAGFNKIRTWFCQSRSDVQILFAANREQMNLAYWQEIDKRVTYCLNHHPEVILQLIPYGEDTAEIIRYGKGDRAALYVLKYAQARFSAFPNVIWCLTNDRHIISRTPMGNRDASPYVIQKMGRDAQNREPWGTLITNHQQRFQGYYFLADGWSDIVTLEDRDQIDGRIILQYRQLANDPVVMDEDRYELFLAPKHPRYYFRRYMWSCLLSGGFATYGGLETYRAYTDSNDTKGVQGYYDAVKAGKLTGGAHDFKFIHQFFSDANVTLVQMQPNDEMAGYDPQQFKCIGNQQTLIVYLANPDSRIAEQANVAATTPSVKLHLLRGNYLIKWYQPTSGKWVIQKDMKMISGGYERELTAPFTGDAVLLLSRKG